MLKTELVQKSPMRVFEKSIDGGLGKGNLGVFTARMGVGKTACLVHVALDNLLNNKHVLHISFADDPHHIESWYKQVFSEVADAYKLDNANDVYEELTPLKMILHYKQDDVTFESIVKDIDLFIQNTSHKLETIIVDRFPFEAASQEEVEKWEKFAKEKSVEIWFSATLHREALQLDDQGIPAPVNQFKNLLTTIVMLEPAGNHIHFTLLKDHDATDGDKVPIKLDPRTLLLANHRV